MSISAGKNTRKSIKYIDLHVIRLSKKILRAYGLKQLKQQGACSRRQKSLSIAQKLFKLPVFKRAGAVCFYVALPEEVDTRSMIDRAICMGKRVVIPFSDLENKELELFEIKSRRTDLKKGSFGIWEPRKDRTKRFSAGDLDLVVVPGIIFDRKKNRLGRGLGFYDRFLSLLSSRIPTAGLAFSFQIISRVPVERHDKPLTFLLTDH